MSAVAETAPAASTLAAPGAKGLRVFVACGDWVLAFPAETVTRLVSLDEAPQVIPAPVGPAGPASHLGGLVIADKIHSAWDLGGLLGLRSHAEAWLLLSLHGSGRERPLALRTGACLSVGPAPPRSARLPQSIAPGRTGLFPQAFVVEGIARARSTFQPVGLLVEPALLFGAAEDAAIEGDLASGGRE